VHAVHGSEAEGKMDDDEALTKAINDLRFCSGCKLIDTGAGSMGLMCMCLLASDPPFAEVQLITPLIA
jgi:hypothetical protein